MIYEIWLPIFPLQEHEGSSAYVFYTLTVYMLVVFVSFQFTPGYISIYIYMYIHICACVFVLICGFDGAKAGSTVGFIMCSFGLRMLTCCRSYWICTLMLCMLTFVFLFTIVLYVFMYVCMSRLYRKYLRARTYA